MTIVDLRDRLVPHGSTFIQAMKAWNWVNSRAMEMARGRRIRQALPAVDSAEGISFQETNEKQIYYYRLFHSTIFLPHLSNKASSNYFSQTQYPILCGSSASDEPSSIPLPVRFRVFDPLGEFIPPHFSTLI